MITFYQYHSDILQQALFFSLNTTILASEIFPKIPKVIPTACRTIFSFIGVVSLNLEIKALFKEFQDCRNSCLEKDVKMVILTAIKVSIRVTSIFLTLGGFFASFATLTINPTIALIYYTYTKKIALFSFVSMIALEIIYHFEIKKLIENSSKIEFTKKIEKFLEPYELDILKKDKETIIKLLKTKLTISTTSFFLKGLGYISMGISKAYPLSSLQTATTWGMSLLYSIQLIYRKIQTQKFIEYNKFPS